MPPWLLVPRPANHSAPLLIDGGVAERALDRGEGRLDLRPSLLSRERRQEPGLLAADVRASAAVDHDVEVEPGALDVLAEETRPVGLRDRAVHDPPRLHVLAADVDEAQVGADGARRDDHPLDHGVRVSLHQVAVLEGARLTLVGVDHEVFRIRGAFRNESPLHARRERRAAQPAQVGLLDLLGDGRRLHPERLGQRRIASVLAVTHERMRVGQVEVAGEDLLGRLVFTHQGSPSRMRSTFSGVRLPS